MKMQIHSFALATLVGHEETKSLKAKANKKSNKKLTRLTYDMGREWRRIVQTGSGVHPTSYTMGNGSAFPGVKRSGREDDNSPPTSAGVKKMWIYTSTPPYAFMA
jgi:hypothetical protein